MSHLHPVARCLDIVTHQNQMHIGDTLQVLICIYVYNVSSSHQTSGVTRVTITAASVSARRDMIAAI